MILSRRSLLCASLLAATPARAAVMDSKPRSYTATHGHALFSTQHLLPGDALDLAQVDRSVASARVIAITIDDGPDPDDPLILETLQRYGARATFFQIGRKIRRYRDIAKAVIDSGNEVGNHTAMHPMMTDLPATEQVENLRTVNQLLGELGCRPTWFRPPYGDFDDKVVGEARALGMRTVLWTLDTKDWKGLDAETIARREIAGLMPGGIALMHSTRPASHAALPTFLAEGLRRGYRFVTLSEWYQAMENNAATAMAARMPPPKP